MRRDIGTDDPRVRVRPGKGSRPRTKRRPDFSDAPVAEVVGVDRGRYRLLLDGTRITAVKARELGRRAVVVGDRVRVTGDISGKKDTLARLVRIEERTSQLRRSPEDGQGREQVVVANADQLAIVTALAQPDPKTGMIDRCLVAAYDAGMTPMLILTKADLADPAPLLAAYEPLGVAAYVTEIATGSPAAPGARPAAIEPAEQPPATERAAHPATAGPAAQPTTTGPAAQQTAIEPAAASGLGALRQALAGHETVLVGHSGVGKSTLINALIPEAERATGYVNDVTGKGRHTSTSAVSLALPDGGRIVDTPGVRGFGLAHVSTEHILRGFVDLYDIAHDCPRGCSHTEAEPECALSEATGENTRARVASFRRLLAARASDDWSQ